MLKFVKHFAIFINGMLLASAAFASAPATNIASTTPLTVVGPVEAAGDSGLLHYTYDITNTATWTVRGSTYNSSLASFFLIRHQAQPAYF